MAVMLRPETETLLREHAERAGLDVDTFTDTLLTDVLADDPDDLTEEEIAEIRIGIQRGVDAVKAGRIRSAKDYKAEVQKHRAERQNMKQSHG